MGIIYNPLLQSGFDFTGTGGGGGGGVTTLNGLSGALNLLAGTGISISPSGSTITISSTGGTVTNVSIVSANGLAGTVANPTTTPAITLSTTVTGILYGNGTSIAPAVSGNFPILNQNTTGTAANITATSNSTLVTLNSLSLPYSQLTGTPTPLTFSDSLSLSGTTVTLKNDSASPTATQYYGTNASSILGYYNLPPPGTGTVTSVALQDSSSTPIYSITGSPVTSNGTLTFTLNTEPANFIFSGPTTGTSSQPTFRALVIADIPVLSSLYVTQSEVGAPLGVATLDASGKIPVGELPSVVMEYQGSWNPTTNTPTLSDGTGSNGNVYYVSALYTGTVAGLTDPSMTNFQIGDLVIYSSAIGKWQLVTPAAGVSFVNGAQGSVTVNAINQLTGDITSGPASGSQSQVATLTATSNSTLVTLSSLSLPGSQVTGNIAGNAANITATSNSTLTTLSSLAFPTSQLTGDISLISQVSGVLPIANGGTDNGSLPVTAGGVIYTDGTMFQNVGVGTSGDILQSNGSGAPTWVPNSSTGITGSYAQAYFNFDANWTTTNTSFSDFTSIGGTPTLTVRQSNGITLTGASGSLPGITFTPASTSAIYLITAQFGLFNNATDCFYQITDGTTVISGSAGGTVSSIPSMMTGIYAPGTTSPVTVKMQGATSGGGVTYIITSTNSDPRAIPLEWTIVRIA